MKIPLIAVGELVGFVDLDRPGPTFRQAIRGKYESQRPPVRDFSLDTYIAVEAGIEAHYRVYLYRKIRDKDEATIRDLIARKEIEPYYMRPEGDGGLKEALDSKKRM